MERHPRGRGLEGDRARTQPSGDRRIRDHAVRPYIEQERCQQEQRHHDHHQAPFGDSCVTTPSDRGSVHVSSGPDVAEPYSHFLKYVSSCEAPSDPDLQALLDLPPTQAHPESSRVGHSSDRLPDFIQMYRSLQLCEHYFRQDTYDHDHPPKWFPRPLASLIKAKETIITTIMANLDQRMISNQQALSTLQRERETIKEKMNSLNNQIEADNKSLKAPELTFGSYFNLRKKIKEADEAYATLEEQYQVVASGDWLF